MPTIIEVIEPEALIWPFGGSDGRPYVMTGQGHWGSRRSYVDPFPAYGHDDDLVSETLTAVQQAFPLPPEVSLQITILPFEDQSRTNGWTQHDWHRDYQEGKEASERRFIPTIVLSGKRIPPHPAMTRYLVAHEYGHVVAGWLAHKAGDQNADPRVVEEEYAKLRYLEKLERGYGGGTWHLDAGEVMANDFRILVCGIETDYWPHPGVPRPEDELAVPTFELREWWDAHRLLARGEPVADASAGGGAP